MKQIHFISFEIKIKVINNIKQNNNLHNTFGIRICYHRGRFVKIGGKS